mgnify:CR=1 FL=1
MTQARNRIDVLVIVLAALMIMLGVIFAFGIAPTANRLAGGDVQRIFYFHVGIAWIAWACGECAACRRIAMRSGSWSSMSRIGCSLGRRF